jgi:hypothetical protein
VEVIALLKTEVYDRKKVGDKDRKRSKKQKAENRHKEKMNEGIIYLYTFTLQYH